MDITGSQISFHDIYYTVQVRPGGKLWGKKEPKEIIKGVNGLFKPGVNAIMGPTGSGKTSLLDIIAGRKNPIGLKGDLLVDGSKQPKNFKCMTGYVVQDDVVMGTLTVRENFMFSANVRLPTEVTTREKEERVEGIIQELGLSHCADTKIGTEFIRGVSGGERKRTNIGMELIIAPRVLFLDEPTTGLDANTANSVILLLKRLGMRGRTIILSIHQPRFSIFRMFDRLMLLSLGKTIYHGPCDEALQFFSEAGYECEAHNNPPDFFLDVINEDQTVLNPINGLETHGNSSNEAKAGEIELQHVQGSSTAVTIQNDENMCEKLHNKFLNSQWNTDLEKELKSIQSTNEERKQDSNFQIEKGEYATGFLTQFRYLSGRTAKNSLRNPQQSILQVFIMTLFALIVGILYFQVSNKLPDGLQNRIGGFFFIIMNQVFGNLAAVELFIQERRIFVHENGSGFYRVSAYFLSKIFCDVVPLRLLPAAVFSLVVYFMMGLQPEVDKFFLFVLGLIMCSLSSTGVGFVMSAAVGVFAIAQLLIALTFVFMMVFGGLFVNLASVWPGLRWLQYLSLFRYSLNFLCINELKGQMYIQEITLNGTTFSRNVTAGEDFMRNAGIPFETNWDFYSNIVALMLMIIVFFTLSYALLRRIPKWK